MWDDLRLFSPNGCSCITLLGGTAPGQGHPVWEGNGVGTSMDTKPGQLHVSLRTYLVVALRQVVENYSACEFQIVIGADADGTLRAPWKTRYGSGGQTWSG